MKRLAPYPAPLWAAPRRSPWRLLLIGVLLCVLAIPLFKIIQISVALRQAYSDAAGFSRVMQGQLDANNLPLAQSLLTNAAASLDQANRAMDVLRPWLEWLAWVPRYGQTLQVLPALLDHGAELGHIAGSALAVAQPLLTANQGALPIERLPAFISTAKPQLADLKTRVDAVEQRLALIPAAELRGGLAEPVASLQASVSLLAAGLRMSDALPDLLGLEEVRTYLLLVQNSHELRATGGFITSIGRLTIADGQIIALEFADSYEIDNVELPHPAAPAPMQRYMQIDRLFLRDVNWSPDLSTTARLAQALYQQNSGQMVDGVITLDLAAVEYFVAALAPLQVAGVEEPITGENFVQQAKALWAAPATSDATLAENSPDWWRQRKDFIPLVAQAAFARLRSGDFNYLRVALALQRALQTRSIQLWFTNPTLNRELAQLRWDGSLHPLPGADYLAVVESNFGYNKANAVVERAVAYTVQWPTENTGAGVATLTITYQHPHPPADEGCDPRPRYGLTYDDMIARCYFSFVRIYVPAGSTLIDSSGFAPDSVFSQAEGENQLFGGYFILAPNQKKEIRLQYQLPASLQAQNYHLVLQKQAGTGPLPFTAQILNQSVATTIQHGWFEWQPGYKE